MTSKDVMKALTRTGGPMCRRRWVVVPNVFWGWGLSYEADMIAVSKSGTCTEIEIKVSRQDLRADKLKRKWLSGLGPMVARFYYAVPEALQEYALEIIPESAGLIVARPGNSATSALPTAKVVRKAKLNKSARKPTDDELRKLHHLGIMRYWDLFLREPEAPTQKKEG
jgi:hypothetical protein